MYREIIQLIYLFFNVCLNFGFLAEFSYVAHVANSYKIHCLNQHPRWLELYVCTNCQTDGCASLRRKHTKTPHRKSTSTRRTIDQRFQRYSVLSKIFLMASKIRWSQGEARTSYRIFWVGPFKLDCDMRLLVSPFIWLGCKEVEWFAGHVRVHTVTSVCLSNLRSYTQSGRKWRSCLHTAHCAASTPAPTLSTAWKGNTLHRTVGQIEFVWYHNKQRRDFKSFLGGKFCDLNMTLQLASPKHTYYVATHMLATYAFGFTCKVERSWNARRNSMHNSCAPVAQHLLLKSASVPLRIPLKEKSITTLPHLWTGLFRDILRLISLSARSCSVRNGCSTWTHASHAPNNGFRITANREQKRRSLDRNNERIPNHPLGIYIYQTKHVKQKPSQTPQIFRSPFSTVFSPTAISMNFAGMDRHLSIDTFSLMNLWLPSFTFGFVV